MLQVSSSAVNDLLTAARAKVQAGRLPEAERDVLQAIKLQPRYALSYQELGVIYLMAQQRAPAAEAFARSLDLQPTVEAFLNLGQILHLSGREGEGIDILRRGVATFPDDVRVTCTLGRALEKADRVDEASDLFEDAHKKWPNSTLLVYYHGRILFFQRQLDRAIALYRDYLKSHPTDTPVHSSLLFTLHFLPHTTWEELLREHKQWDRMHAEPLHAECLPHLNSRDPDRRLRIGYISADFRNHGVGRFIEPILKRHDPAKVELFAYSDVGMSDSFTARIRKSVPNWRNIYVKSHADVTDIIRKDQIDILVDLTMHMPMNRMLVFARKPAPVQVTYLAYCSTTGLSSIDYRLSDPHLDLAGCDERYVEKTIRLPESWWLYDPPADAPPVAIRTSVDMYKPVVFGSMNNIAKVSDDALETWSEILRAVPDSTLLMHCVEGKVRKEILATLARFGINEGRVEFIHRIPTLEYLAQHHRIDVLLDSFPYAGGTTTCDGLWMGAPVVTLAGDQAVGRGSMSILTNIGLADLIARTRRQYVEIAVKLARDPQRRADLRESIRDRMRGSPLMNGATFMHGLENAYRTMWRTWCATPES